MAQVTLLPNTSTVTTGSSFFLTTAVDRATLQFTPQSNTGFSGIVYIDSSTSPAPTNNDWFTIATLTFSAHTSTVAIDLFLSNNPWVRARISKAPTLGSVSVYMAY
jgi:hypothetical protein